ncbi:transporter suffix domain-containing protein [Microvirga terricola]|uniref:Transporter suffix domain-containing protein n=1 Tax=Microvirga terricola TaxID=2719797 RepID=A0ABX0VDS8_9HYPH|nr:transporter suffix domain-containing protein [Microvirga terricola]NIX77329.1 transporter suffix domain-containing protein [Microvirga terricola]
MTTFRHELGPSSLAGRRCKLGIAIFILAFVLWLLVPLAAALQAPPARIAAMSGAIFVANKVMLVICVAVMGKEGFLQLKAILSRALFPTEVGPTRYTIGLVMFCLPLVSAMLEPYVEQFWPDAGSDLWLKAVGDLMLIASFFVLGGEFWNKVHALFVRTAKVVDTGRMDASGTASGIVN